MKKGSMVLFVGIVSLLASCDREEVEVDHNNLIVGTWVDAQYHNDGYYTITRKNEFRDDADGMQFKADGTMLNRANSGWCGTPPISYTNYEGTWKPLNDTLIEVTSAYWGGVETFKLNIISIDEEKMQYKLVLNSEQ